MSTLSHNYPFYCLAVVCLLSSFLASASPVPYSPISECVTTIGPHDPLYKNGQSVIPCPSLTSTTERPATTPIFTSVPACITTVGLHHPLYISGKRVNPCPPTSTTLIASSPAIARPTITTTTTAMITAIPTTLTSAVTTTSTTTYTSTIIPPQPTRIVPQFKAPPPSYKQSSLKLWESRPTRQDLVLAPTDQQELGNWKEISAVCDALIVSAPWFLPEAVFGVPEDSTAISSSDASGPLARVDDQIPNLAIVPLNLFPLSEKPLVVDVSFNVGLDTSHAVWQRAISAAFLHSDVQDRLESIRKSYIGPFLEDTDPKGNKFKAMAIFEMLTGFSADVTEQPCPQNGNVIDKVSTPLFEKLDGKDENMDWSWLYNDFVEMVQNRTLVYPPTVMFSSDQKLRSVTIPNSFDLFILNLADPARPEADKDAQGNPIEYPLKQVQAMLVWSVRQKDLSIPLNSTSTRELIRKKVPTQSEYYQNGPWEPLPAANA